MQIKWNKKYTTIAVYSCIVAAVMIVIFFAFINIRSFGRAFNTLLDILSPIMTGAILAYLLNPIYRQLLSCRLFARLDKGNSRPVLKKTLALISTYVIFLAVITVVILLFVPQVMRSYYDLQSKVSGYVESVRVWLEDASKSSGLLSGVYDKMLSVLDYDMIVKKMQEFITGSFDLILSGTSTLFGMFLGFINQIKNIFFGFVISIYMLSAKDMLIARAKKIIFAVLSLKAAKRLMKLARDTDRTFGGFIVGKIIDSFIIGALTFIVLWIFRIPYYPLISVIVGITNVIPFFGPFIGAIPSAFIIFVADPLKALIFIAIIIVIQQIDGNVIGPKIIGSSIGLSGLGIIIAIVIMGGFFGIAGMFIGVPLFAVIYSLVKESAENRLKKKSLPVDTESYSDGSGEGGPR